MRKNYPYEKDKDFLSKVCETKVQNLLIKINVLTWEDERIIQEIQGRVIGGSLNINKSSPIRRSGSLDVYVDETNKDVLNVDNIISINKKVYIELGIENSTNQYTKYDYIWFKLGLFILTDLSIESNADSGVRFSINISDKMCLLDGSMGGVFTSATDLDTEIEYDISSGEDVEKKVVLGKLITELVHHIGGEKLNNIVISDLEPTVSTALNFNSTIYNSIYKKADEAYDLCKTLWNNVTRNENEKEFAELDKTQQYTKFFNYVRKNYFPTSHLSNKDIDLLGYYMDIYFIKTGFFSSDEYKALSGNLLNYANYSSLDEVPVTYFTDNILRELLNSYILYTPEMPSNWKEVYKAYVQVWNLMRLCKTGIITNNQVVLNNKWQITSKEFLECVYVGYNDDYSYKFYEFKQEEMTNEVKDITLIKSNADYVVINADNIGAGYRLEDLFYTEKLSAAAGDSITSALDKIVQQLGGNFEYFYDTDGVFHFQEIKNNLNTTVVTELIRNNKSNNEIYDNINYDISKPAYSFDNSNMVQSFHNNLQFSTIRNDFVLWGTKKTKTSDNFSIWYHLVIDDKPIYGEKYYDVVITYDKISGDRELAEFQDRPILKKPILLDEPYPFSKTEQYYKRVVKANGDYDYVPQHAPVPSIDKPRANCFYIAKGTVPLDLTVENTSASIELPKLWIWNPNPKVDKDSGHTYQMEPHWVEYNEFYNQTEFSFGKHPSIYARIKAKDWRNELYLDGVEKSQLYSNPNYYYPELSAYLWQIYNVAEVGIDEAGRPSNYTNLYCTKTNKKIPVREGKLLVPNQMEYAYNVNDILPWEFTSDSFTLDGSDTYLTKSRYKHNNTTLHHYNVVNNMLSHSWIYVPNYGYFMDDIETNTFFLQLKYLIKNKINNNFPLISTLTNIENKKKEEYTDVQIQFNDFVEKFRNYSDAEDAGKSRRFLHGLANQLEDIKNYIETKTNNSYFYDMYIDARYILSTLDSIYCDKNAFVSHADNVFTIDYEYCAEVFLRLLSLTSIFMAKECRYPFVYNTKEYPENNLIIQLPQNDYVYYEVDIHERVKEGFKDNFSDYPYYIDFINASSAIGKYSVSNIGRRTDSVNNSKLNCMIDPEVPYIYLVEDASKIDMSYHKGESEDLIKEKINKRIEQCIAESRPYAIVPSNILFGMLEDHYQGLYEAARDLLYVETSNADKITLTTMPLYHLDVNTRINVKNPDVSIFGEYLIDSISVPLDVEGTMSISCTKIINKI